MKSQFLANVSHELRTPLNAMVGYVSLLEGNVHGELNQFQRERLERVQANCRHLTSLLNDLLELARIEVGKLPTRVREFAIGDVVDEVLEEVEPLVSAHGPRVIVEVADDLPLMRSDRKKVKQILINFLSNALKFTEKGAIVIRAQPRDRDRMAISVADTGVGIPAENHRTIFEAFAQVDSSYTSRHSGTGLGLSICKRLAEVLGGDIRLVSEVGKGATFTLVLPCVLEEEA
jgi:signal transduction histidine kinase